MIPNFKTYGDFPDIYGLPLKSGTIIYDRFTNLDMDMLRPEYWKLDKFNNLTNTWCKFYIDETTSVTIFGVNISLSKAPIVIETPIKGKSAPFFQQFSNDTYEINIQFLESGPTFWQQNIKQLKKLSEILDTPNKLQIANPQLNLTYDITSVVVLGYEIGQHSNYYSHTPISIKLKNDDEIDILNPITL